MSSLSQGLFNYFRNGEHRAILQEIMVTELEFELESLLCFLGIRVLGGVRRFAGGRVSLPVVEVAEGVVPTRAVVVGCARLCCCCWTCGCCVPP